MQRRRLQRSRELLRVRRRGQDGRVHGFCEDVWGSSEICRTNPSAQQSCPVTCELDTLNCPRHIEHELMGSVGAFVQFDFGNCDVAGYSYIDDPDECTAPSTSFSSQFHTS